MVAAMVLAGCSAGSGEDTPGTDAAVPATGQGAQATPPTVTSSRRGPVLLIVGTSLTAGLGIDPEDAYPALLQRMADSAGIAVRVMNGGLSGETSAGALRRIEWLLNDPPDAVLIETGANDGLRALDVDSTRANIRAIVRRVKAVVPDAPVMLAQMESPPNLGDRYTSAFRDIFPTISREEGVTLVPFLLDRVAGVAEFNQADGIHPNEAGARLVAENVFRAIEPVLRRLQPR